MKDKPEFKTVEVTLPVVKLRLEDLSYLKGLLTEGPKCRVPFRNKDRLRILGLIENVKLPPCPKETRVWLRKEAKFKRQVLRETKKQNWNWKNISNIYLGTKPQEREETVVTMAGRKLLKNGTYQAQIQKGCR